MNASNDATDADAARKNSAGVATTTARASVNRRRQALANGSIHSPPAFFFFGGMTAAPVDGKEG
jgi:hypothetical protein